MGMETLKNAAQAAGFAMAASDEPHEKARTEAAPGEIQWRPGEAVMIPEPARFGPRVSDWIRTLLGLFGKRAPASSA